MLNALAFIAWDLAGRSPLQVARDVAAGFARPSTFIRGVTRIAIGIVALASSLILVLPMMLRTHQPTAIELWPLLAGLAVEAIVGPDIRARFGRPARP